MVKLYRYGILLNLFAAFHRKIVQIEKKNFFSLQSITGNIKSENTFSKYISIFIFLINDIQALFVANVKTRQQ